MPTHLSQTVQEVLALNTFTPDDTVNATMTALVEGVVRELHLPSLDQQTQSRVRTISAAAEMELEKFWATTIIDSKSPQKTLATFPYIDNYRELTRRELALTQQSGLLLNSSHRALIIGSGPLPLSALEIHRQSSALVDHVDSSLEAIDLSANVSKTLGINSRHLHGLGQTVTLTDTYDLILIAALAGETATEKQAIIDNVLPHLSAQGRIIVRSARGSRELLYPAIAAHELSHLTLLEEYHPDDYIINSVFIYEREV